MTTTVIEDETGEEHTLFQCDICGRVPVLDLLDEHPEHEKRSEMFRDDGMLKGEYLRPSELFHILQWDGEHDSKRELCDECRTWVEYLLDAVLPQEVDER